MLHHKNVSVYYHFRLMNTTLKQVNNLFSGFTEPISNEILSTQFIILLEQIIQINPSIRLLRTLPQINIYMRIQYAIYPKILNIPDTTHKYKVT